MKLKKEIIRSYGEELNRGYDESGKGKWLTDSENNSLTSLLFGKDHKSDNVERGEGEGRSRARRMSRAVQERGDIASKQQGSPFRTDYNKLATLIETNGKLSALFSCNAIPIKVGECFCNLRLVMLFD
ncbi:hypothetical protein GQ457_08G027950 [Hibiscus cannabinus]